MTARNFQNWCSGRPIPSNDFEPVIDPATLEIVGNAPRSSIEDVDEAVRAALAAQNATWNADEDLRREAIEACAGAIEEHLEELATLLSREQGKTLAGAKNELAIADRILRHFASKRDVPTVLRASSEGTVRGVRAPIGAVGLIVPWNYPVAILMMKLAPALWAGNSVVVKPAPTTPLTTLRLAELFSSVLPEGVLNTVSGDGAVGQALVAHGGLGKISFTGSSATGRKVMKSAAGTLKRLTMELGGNDAAIVLSDVDAADVSPRLFAGAFTNAGQLCAAIKRLYVHRDVFDDIVDRLAEQAAKWRVGPGLDPSSQMGPLHSRAQRDHVLALLSDARSRGGRVHAGGDVPAEFPGHFLRPAIVSGLTEEARLVAEEQFGPALPVMAFDDVDEAIRRANSSPYGLGGSIWSSDVDRAASLATRLEAVNLYVNQHAVSPDPEIPFGGTKASGFGYELGEWGTDEFSLRKVLNVAARRAA